MWQVRDRLEFVVIVQYTSLAERLILWHCLRLPKCYSNETKFCTHFYWNFFDNGTVVLCSKAKKASISGSCWVALPTFFFLTVSFFQFFVWQTRCPLSEEARNAVSSRNNKRKMFNVYNFVAILGRDDVSLIFHVCFNVPHSTNFFPPKFALQ